MISYGAGSPLERMAVDICGPLHVSKSGNKYIIVIMDYFTKWTELIPVVDHTAETVAYELVTKVFSRIGIPQTLHSDQGRDFLSKLFTETCRLFGIHKTQTSPWRPQSDGLVERLNRTLGSMLRQYVNESQTDWDYWLPFICMAYNSSEQTSTKFSPYFLMFGREMRMPVELILPQPESDILGEMENYSELNYVEQMVSKLQSAFSLVRQNLKTATLWQKRVYDRRRNVIPLHRGQGVWLYNPMRKKGRTPKLDSPWQGPFAIIQMLNNNLAEIGRGVRHKTKIVHVDKLIPVRGRYDGSWVVYFPKKKSWREQTDEVLKDIPRLFSRREENMNEKPTIEINNGPARSIHEYSGPITRSRAKQQ